MSDTFNLIKKLNQCYQEKVPNQEAFNKLGMFEKRNLCSEQKKELLNYVNSKDYTFQNIVLKLHDDLSKDPTYPWKNSSNPPSLNKE